MRAPERLDLSQEEIDALLDRVETRSLCENDYETIKAMAETLRYLSLAVEEKSHSIGRLLRQIFGPKTEKLKNVFPPEQDEPCAGDPHDTSEGAGDRPRQVKGHGRHGESAYRPVETVEVTHSTLKPADRCPQCRRGKVYASLPPMVLIRIVGRPPLEARRYKLQRLRCNLCGQVFTADTPEGVSRRKYDEQAVAILAMLKYGFGVPFYRMNVFHANLGVPLPPSTQWDLVEELAELLRPVYKELVELASRGRVIHNDDTGMTILSLVPHERSAQEKQPERTGVFTSAMISLVEDKTIALFLTGRRHAGEALEALLGHRPAQLAPPIQMCDALDRNVPKAFATILGNCLVHARRKFVEVATSFPNQCRHVIETLAQVYRNDEQTAVRGMTPSGRLRFHQMHSKPLMEELKLWLHAQVDGKLVEPNSGLGKAIAYMVRHWEPLTLFLRTPGAPLDNNIVERALKFAILHRKNSLFYKTQHGADVGDILMSVIHTCRLAGVDIFVYLTQLQKHADEVRRQPADWLPWNYTRTLTSIAA